MEAIMENKLPLIQINGKAIYENDPSLNTIWVTIQLTTGSLFLGLWLTLFTILFR